MRNLLIFIIFAFLISTQALTIDDLMDAIHQVETGGKTGAILGDYDKVNKTYRALGPLQIWKSFYDDAKEYDVQTGGKFLLTQTSYQDCASLIISKRVALAYFNRYAKKAIKSNDYEKLSRIFNGGPNGDRKTSTVIYWKKVQKYLYF